MSEFDAICRWGLAAPCSQRCLCDVPASLCHALQCPQLKIETYMEARCSLAGNSTLAVEAETVIEEQHGDRDPAGGSKTCPVSGEWHTAASAGPVYAAVYLLANGVTWSVGMVRANLWCAVHWSCGQVPACGVCQPGRHSERQEAVQGGQPLPGAPAAQRRCQRMIPSTVASTVEAARLRRSRP